MKNACFLAFSLALVSSCTIPTLALNGLPKVKSDDYQTQVPKVATEAATKLQATGKLTIKNYDMLIAPPVLKIDFQNNIKVDKKVNVVGENLSWWDVEDSIWGFEYSIDNAYTKIFHKLTKKIKVYALDAETLKMGKTGGVYIPVPMPETNSKYPSKTATVVYNRRSAFNGDDVLEVSKKALAKFDTTVVFYPYINMAFTKQNIGLANFDGEHALNYSVAMNGYFVLCNQTQCVTSQLPKNQNISLIIPLVGSNIITSKETRGAVQEYAQELMGDVISDFAVAAFEKLSKNE